MITIQKREKTGKGWKFVVSVEGDEFTVELGKEYWQKLTHSTGSGQAGGKEEPEGLLRRSFEFLLARESKESILREFNLSLIQKYFPEFEEKIKLTEVNEK